MSVKTLKEPELKKPKVDDESILKMLWEIVDKPKNSLKIKVINVFDNAYRINVWSEYYDSLHNIQRVRISNSYFCKINNDVLTIKA